MMVLDPNSEISTSALSADSFTRTLLVAGTDVEAGDVTGAAYGTVAEGPPSYEGGRELWGRFSTEVVGRSATTLPVMEMSSIDRKSVV